MNIEHTHHTHNMFAEGVGDPNGKQIDFRTNEKGLPFNLYVYIFPPIIATSNFVQCVDVIISICSMPRNN